MSPTLIVIALAAPLCLTALYALLASFIWSKHDHMDETAFWSGFRPLRFFIPISSLGVAAGVLANTDLRLHEPGAALVAALIVYPWHVVVLVGLYFGGVCGPWPSGRFPRPVYRRLRAQLFRQTSVLYLGTPIVPAIAFIAGVGR